MILLSIRWCYKNRKIWVEWNRKELVKKYICIEQQFVQIGQSESESLNVTCCVPQGSVFGPEHFITYISDKCRVNVDKHADVSCVCRSYNLISYGKEERHYNYLEKFNKTKGWFHQKCYFQNYIYVVWKLRNWWKCRIGNLYCTIVIERVFKNCFWMQFWDQSTFWKCV